MMCYDLDITCPLFFNLQKLQKKNNATLDDLNYHPVANSELVKKTIARITQDYRERKENIEETGHGHPVLQCH